MDSDTGDEDEPEVRAGRRVICRKQGPFDGKRGRVADTIGEVAMVNFGNCTIMEKKSFFEPITYES